MLESVYVGADRNLQDLRFPVQLVNRPDATFRGFSGSIVSGTIRRGDEVMTLPSRKRSRVRSIVTMNGDLDEAQAPLSVTVTLEDELDVSRGDMIVRCGNLPQVSRSVESMVVWMSEQPLALHKQYWLKTGNLRTSCEVEAIRYSVDVNTLHRQSATALQLNEIGRCHIATHDPLVFDPYQRNRATGSFILVDRITHETAAAGMILDRSKSDAGAEQTAKCLRRVSSSVSNDARAAHLRPPSRHRDDHGVERVGQDDSRAGAGESLVRGWTNCHIVGRREHAAGTQWRPGIFVRGVFGESPPRRGGGEVDQRCRADLHRRLCCARRSHATEIQTDCRS